MTRIVSLVFVGLSLILLLATLQATRVRIGEPFPGFLTFKNGVVGPYYLPGWAEDPRERMVYHAIPEDLTDRISFGSKDYFLIVLLPAVTGLLFVLLGLGVSSSLPLPAGRLPLSLFHFLVGNYLILSPEFQLTHHFSYLHLLVFLFIPPLMIHFALLFPERDPGAARHPFLYAVPYLASLLLAAPYLGFFMSRPRWWIFSEYAAVLYVVASYLFWIYRLVSILRRPHLEFNRLIARSLLLGQVVGFVVPLAGVIAIFVLGVPFPLNLATPFTLLFPISLLVGVILGRLRQSQMQLIQAEKKGALGNLLAGLAHELNNPMTFVYSNIEPLREILGCLEGKPSEGERLEKLKELGRLTDNMEEGATRARGIIESFRHFSHPGKSLREPVDIHGLLEQSLLLLTPKWKDRIVVEKRFGSLAPVVRNRMEIGQVFVNLLANACEAIEGKGTIGIGTSFSGNSVEIRISDSGRGIPQKEISRIFDPFYTTKPPGEGTGLGLAIASQILKKHGGRIEVKSQVGNGTEFVVRIPE